MSDRDFPSQLSEETARELLLQLRRKQGNWVNWGQACQQLQKAGYGAPHIFEETGIEGSYQNLVIVGAQVFETLVKAGASEELQVYYQGPRSDVMYEFRILAQEQRLAAAQLAMEKRLDVDEAREAARAIKAFSRFPQPPKGFTAHPGDAVAYQCWKLARAKKDLQERSRLIAQGLKFAYSPAARESLEKLLSDFTVVAAERAPILPLYRLEVEEQLPRLIPVVGELPLSPADVEAVAKVEEIEPFRLVRFSGTGSYVPIPGWQVVLKAEDPVAILCDLQSLPNNSALHAEQVVVVADRRSRDWDANSYFLVAAGDEVEVQWEAERPEVPILGRIVLILRPKRILDESNLTEPWQMDD